MNSYKHWLEDQNIRPYVFVRKNNLPKAPSQVHSFRFPNSPLMMEPFETKNSGFATQILRLENRCFQSIGLTLPRWAFYDCSLMPGLVVGYCYKREALPESIRRAMPIDEKLEYVPISLFICIPTAQPEHWVAHNLCSVSSILPPEDRLSSLGFITKSFGLSYFNIKHLYGMTQWGSQALKVHTNYGRFQVVSAYNEIHDYHETLTYLVDVDASYWVEHLDGVEAKHLPLRASKYTVHPKNKTSMKNLHRAIERGEGPFYLNPKDFNSTTEDSIQIYNET